MIVKKKSIIQTSASIGFLIVFAGCGNTVKDSDEAENTRTPVTITTISKEPMTETIELNAVSYFRKNIIKSSATGHIEKVDVLSGDMVEKGQQLFSVKTKEASAIEKSNVKDSSFVFSGLIKIVSPKSGAIISIAHQSGDYVQEGDELAQLAEQNSLLFMLEVPFEFRSNMSKDQKCEIRLSDNKIIQGIIVSSLPVMDMQSQIENFIVKPITSEKLPENLIAKISIVKSRKENGIVLPKPAVLSNETQTEFWVMKLVNDSLAVKTPIKIGIENAEKVEILSPIFSGSDRILLTGNYGLPDSARVVIK